jgi:signal transduction histidine kinase/CheY-like chemotaxis protein/HAMP domain-containing protein
MGSRAPRPKTTTSTRKTNGKTNGKGKNGAARSEFAGDALDKRELLSVLAAFRRGVFTARMPSHLDGVDGRIADTLNELIELHARLAAELRRLSRAVGEEGRTSQRASLSGVSGAWADSVDSVNNLIVNLVHPTSETARVIGAVARGDLSQTMSLDVEGRPLRGEFLATAKTVNTMVAQLGSFASEVTRVAREVGTEGKLGGQARVKGAAGTWKDLTDSVNLMAGNLTAQVRNIAEVATAVATGDLSRKITVDVRGEILQLKNTLNTMVDQLNSFASEVTRVAREVGTEGKLGGQADVKGVAGVWRGLTENVNLMAGNLTAQVRNIAEVATAVATGDLSRKITVDVKGEILQLKNTLNTMVDQLNSFASEVTRVAREVGTEGKLGGQADVKGVAGVWKDLTDNVNSMAGNLTDQVRGIANVVTAVATGDLSRKITVDVKGEILELKNTINTMVDRLNSFAAEVTRVAREVGTDGKLGGQADVKGVAGVWKDLTDNVNSMATNLTERVREIAKVVTAVANGELKRKLTGEAKGEIAALADTINGMIETLATFADQVTTVAREVGVEGQLGGQASVPGAAGTWRALTDNVNQLAANLTTQMRAIAEVATAVTTGDLTRSIAVEARGEVAALKDNINEMIRHLRDTTQKNTDQDWLKTNLAKFSRMLQGQKDLLTVGRLILSELAPVVNALHGVFYILDNTRAEPELRLLAGYAHQETSEGERFTLGEGLVGQCAFEKEAIVISGVPPEYIRVSSGLGECAPSNVIVLPVLFESQVKAVIELASLAPFNVTQRAFLDQLAETIGIVLNTIDANSRTEDLLKQSQSLAKELQNQQEELRQTNQQLEEKAELLAERNVEVERQNREIDKARLALEEKATQLALTSKYKSEFLANMSHELRTPLNSLLILSDELSRNTDGNLTGRQTEFAKTIHASGTDLLTLINDILDLSKIESGTVSLEVGDVRFADLGQFVERTFRHVAESKALRFTLAFAPDLPRVIQTDAKRLQQVVKNLLSNAFKFTERGSVTLSVELASGGWRGEREALSRADAVVAFSVRDTGIGIPPEKHQVIFEAFQQADGSTNRRYGGTGLGLAISREIASLLAGELTLDSVVGDGSTFTLYLPLTHPASKAPRKALDLPAAFLPRMAATGAVAKPAEEEDAPLDRVPDDRGDYTPENRVLLIVENDDAFAGFLLEVARERGWRGVVASSGASAVALARDVGPDAVTLDLRLPDIDGWRLLRMLRADLHTRHIPVLVISTDDEASRGYELGAVGVLAKPVSNRESLEGALDSLAARVDHPAREVLIAAPEPTRALLATRLAEDPELRVTCVATARDAVAAIAQTAYDCVIVESPERDESVEELERLAAETPPLRVVWYEPGAEAERGAELYRPQARYASTEETLDAAAFFLRRRVDELPGALRSAVQSARRSRRVLAGRKALVVDDDIRNIFALTSILEKHGMAVVSAESGQAALDLLEQQPDFDIALLDIMMPGMDGFETLREIRKKREFGALPVIAVTARAMKGDREKTLRAGAWDYLAKPVDAEHLLSVLESWLER